MKNLIHIYIFVIFALVNILPLCTGVPTTASIGFISGVLKIISSFQSLSSNSPNPTLQDNYFKLMHAIDKIKIGENLRSIKEELERLNQYAPKQADYFNQFSRLYLGINKIEAEYRAMLIKVQKMRNGTELNPVDRYITDHNVVDYLNSKSSLLKTISNINYTFIVDGTSTSKSIKDNATITGPSSCSEESQLQSNQQGLQKLFASIVISQVKVLLTAQLAADYVNRTKGSYPAQNLEEVSVPVGNQYQATVKLFKKLMQDASRDVWVCDPQPHDENTTFIQLVNVFQQQIVDIDNFDDSISRAWDIRNRILYKIWPKERPGKNVQSKVWRRHPVIPDYEARYYDVLKKQTLSINHAGPVFKYNSVCQGYVRDCKLLNVLFDVKLGDRYLVCHSLPDSNRRFDRIEIANQGSGEVQKVFGTNEPCDSDRQHRNIIGDAFVCTCDETLSEEPTMFRSRYSYRFFYTGHVYVSSKSYVVTGVKLGQYKGIIYPMIQEGRWLREDVIDRDSLRWIDPAENQQKLTSPENLVRIHWEDRTIKLGDIDLPTNKVLTGLFFTRRNLENRIDGPLRLALMYREFDFKTGNTSDEVYERQIVKDDYGTNASDTFDYTYSPMVEIDNLPLPDLNLRSTVIESDKYLNFTTSDFETDLGQTTIPYLDVQNVTMAVPVPMGGAGLYYKHTPGHTGFIGIKLKTYDISQHIADPTETLPESVKEAFQAETLLRDGTLGIYNKNDK